MSVLSVSGPVFAVFTMSSIFQFLSTANMLPGWSGFVPVQLIFLPNSYILNTFLYDKKLSMSTPFHFEQDLGNS